MGIFICNRCQSGFDNLTSLTKHASRKHKISPAQIVLEVVHNNVPILCACGCGAITNYDKGHQKYREFAKGHFVRKIGGFNTKEGIKNSIKTRQEKAAKGLYKGVASKELRKGRSERMSGKNNVMYNKKHNDSTKEKISIKRKEWNKTNPDKVNLHLKKYWKTVEARDKQRERQITWLEENNYGGRVSDLENSFKSLLDSLSLSYTFQFRLNNKLFDFHIKDTKVLIEVDGDYWHVNPKYHIEAKHPTQQRTLANDLVKNRIAESEGYVLLRFWEDDIKNNVEFIKSKLLSVLK